MQRLGLAPGTASSIGSLPHRDADEAARFSLATLGLPIIPTLPKRSPAEGMVAQALVGLAGVTIGQYGSIAVDADAIDPEAPVVTDLNHDSFGGFRAFLDAAGDHTGAVKWQFIGPVTLGLVLQRAGVASDLAFDVAVRAVRSHLQQLSALVTEAMPSSRQVVFIDEPSLDALLQPGFPLAPDTAIDLMSTSLASVEPAAMVGLHVCSTADLPSLLAVGPSVLSIPVSDSVADAAGYLVRFLEQGGLIAWGVVPTDGPIATSVERPWKALNKLWCTLVQRGADPVQLRQQCMVTPTCGLGMHSPSVAERVHRLTTELGHRVRDQAEASRFVLGA
jgi:methionine synthase II (cobalamin-independent)